MKNRIPPPVWMLICGILAYLVNLYMPSDMGAESGRILIAMACVFIAAVFLTDSVVGFIKSKTTVNPLQPDKASTLVVSGVFRVSRNPMYLGMLFCLVAWVFFIGNVFSAVGPILFGIIMNVFQIMPEEKALAEKFGEPYLDYCKRVRRWL